MSKIYIFLLDKYKKPKEQFEMIKPATYKELSLQLRQKSKNIPKNFDIFIVDENNNNKELKINNEEKYKMVKELIFISEADKNMLRKSIFDLNYNRLSESNKEKIEEKYNCILCSIFIKNEKPFFCYKCQKIFHEKCLQDWNSKCLMQNRNLVCPNCRDELPIEKWNKKLDYEENRKGMANLMNKINEYKLNNNMINSINKIKDKKINELIFENNKQNQMIKELIDYNIKIMGIFSNIPYVTDLSNPPKF